MSVACLEMLCEHICKLADGDSGANMALKGQEEVNKVEESCLECLCRSRVVVRHGRGVRERDIRLKWTRKGCDRYNFNRVKTQDKREPLSLYQVYYHPQQYVLYCIRSSSFHVQINPPRYYPFLNPNFLRS
jgi:hypothetical protein